MNREKVKDCVKKITSVILTVAFCTVMINYQYQILNTLLKNGSAIDMMKYVQEFRMKQFEHKIRDIIKEQLLSANRELVESDKRAEIEKGIQILKKLQEDTVKAIANDCQTIDTKDIQKLVGANVMMINRTMQCMGSGTHVKIKNKHYILSCAHLINYPDEQMVVIMEDGTEHPLKYVNHHQHFDLSLFEVQTNAVRNLPYVEIAEEGPEIGSAVLLIGNPAGNINVVTSGIVAKMYPYAYLMTNLIYSGNSGGGIFYKGKLVGVATQIRINSRGGVIFVNYSYGTNLKTIKFFLETTKL